MVLKENDSARRIIGEVDAANKLSKRLDRTRRELDLEIIQVMEENEKLHHAHIKGMRRMQVISEKLKLQMDRKKLNRESKRKKRVRSDDEAEENLTTNSLVERNIMTQKKYDENLLWLVESYKTARREKEAFVVLLEKQLDTCRNQEMEIQQLKGQLQIIQPIECEDCSAIKNKMEETSKQLQEKIEEIEYLEALNKSLVVKERWNNDELQEARRELIKNLSDILNSHSFIRIKWIGELNLEPFETACKERFSDCDAEIKASTFLSKWQNELRNPHWHPFRVINSDGKPQEVIDEDDEKLQALKAELGDEVYKAVTTALLEMDEHNGGGRHVVPEIWNYREGRRATLKEIINCIL